MVKKAIITFIIATLLWTLLICIIVLSPSIAHAKEVKQIKQTTKTSKDYKIQEQNFNLCIQSGKTRSECQYLYR